MSIRRKTKLEEISAASMSDIAFLLLIFFMVASVFYVKEGLLSTLPKKNSQPKLVLKKNIYKVEIENEKITLSNPEFGKKSYTNFKEFKKSLDEEIQVEDINNKFVVISGRNTKIQNIISVLSAMKNKGFINISLQRSLK